MHPESEARPRRYLPARGSRALAALAYLGGISLVLVGCQLRSRFAQRHALVALGLHLLRFAWAGLVLAVWAVKGGGGETSRYAWLAFDLGTLLLTGVPLAPGHGRDILYALSLPLGSTWLLALGGLIAAATGRTADLRALLSADWPDEPVAAAAEAAPPIDERSYARELREKRLARFWHASRAAAIERQRRERIAAVRAAMGEVLVRLDHLNHLLSVGEISMNRFTAVHAEWIAYLDALRTELIELESRRAAPSSVQRAPVPPTLVDLPPVRALTLAVVDRSGVPIATYGHFPLDETVVTGMLAAFESLSAEMFGSQVHKTQLAQGQVVHFARGRAVIAFALFEDEPAPVQVAQLRAFLDEFEQANAGVLGRLPIDPDHLTPIPVPFTFARRLEQAAAAAREAEPLLAGAPGIEPWAAAPTPDAGR